MAAYAVGDIQGCLGCLERLLANVNFQPDQDTLWSVGDLVNRGPRSLDTLRFCKGLGEGFRTVLGNHDLHLLAVAHRRRQSSAKDTLDDIFAAPDRLELLDWLHQQPLLFADADYAVVHAGIPPQWDLDTALARADEVATVLRSEQAGRYFDAMYGNEPNRWRDDLEAPERWRMITNYFTRMRYCDGEGRLELKNKQAPPDGPEGFAPWYAHRHRKTAGDKIIFGHWAALEGEVDHHHLFPLDTGCVWGGRMRLMDLASEAFIHTNCAKGGFPAPG